MKNLFHFSISKPSLIMFSFFLGVFALNAQETASASSAATIVTTSTIEKLNDLDFGDLLSGSTAGTSVIAADGAGDPRSVTGGVVASATPGNINPARFRIVGAVDATFTLTLPTTIILTNADGNTMEVDTFTTSLSFYDTDLITPGIQASTDYKMPASGRQNFYLGATLHVSANQQSGLYTNASDLTVTINF